MKIVKPSAKIINNENKLKLIEKVGRVCYKSESLTTSSSYIGFIRGLLGREHYAMLEHGNIILSVTENLYEHLRTAKYASGEFIYDTTFLNMSCVPVDKIYIISGSFRAFRDMFLKAKIDPYFLLCTLYYAYPLIFEDVVHTIYGEVPSKDVVDGCGHSFLIDESGLKLFYYNHPNLLMEHQTHTVHFVCDRGISHEFVRHRNCAFAQESTRYCNYSRSKFGDEITVILPFFFDTSMGTSSNSLMYEAWKYSCEVAEKKYLELLSYGATPQEARSVLPNSLKTELVITCTEKEWQHIINLRYHGTTGAPHPQMKEVISIAYELLVEESEGRLK